MQAAQRFLTLTQLRAALASPSAEIGMSSGLPSVSDEHLSHSQVRVYPGGVHAHASAPLGLLPYHSSFQIAAPAGGTGRLETCRYQAPAWRHCKSFETALTPSWRHRCQVKEGQELELPERVPCAVAFLRNEERNVFLAMHGLPRPPEGVEFGRPLPKAVVRSVPLVLLADAGTRMSTGAL